MGELESLELKLRKQQKRDEGGSMVVNEEGDIWIIKPLVMLRLMLKWCLGLGGIVGGLKIEERKN